MHRRAWLAAGLVLGLFLAIWFADQAGRLGRRVALGPPYLGECVGVDKGFHCSGSPATLKAITLPLRLKKDHEYTIRIEGRSLAPEAALVYVDFYGGKNYDSAEQKGYVRLLAGRRTTHVLRWSSGIPPAEALLRLSSRESTDYEISSIRVERSSHWVPRLRDGALIVGLALLARALWRSRSRTALATLRESYALWRWRTPVAGLVLVAAGVAILLLIRVAGLGVPMVFGDEMSYSLLSASLGDPWAYSHNPMLLPLPNQLYFDVFHLATTCGESTLDCARAMNSIVFALAAFPLFALARRFLPARWALAVTAAALLLPNSAYVSFFMPEATYFLVFCCTAWAFAGFIDRDGGSGRAAVCGFLLAALSLVKPHGLTILLACNLTLLVGVIAWRQERRRLARGWIVLLVLFAASRALLGISAAPDSGEPVFDRMFGLYADLLKNAFHSTSDPQALHRLWLATIDNLGSLFVLFGLPLLSCALFSLRRRTGEPSPESVALARFNLFVLVTSACLLVGTIKFTAYIAGADPSQDPARVHERYYDFVFALVLIAGLASWRAVSWKAQPSRAAAWLVFVPAAATAAWYCGNEFLQLHASWIDHPTLAGLAYWQASGIPWVALLAVASLLVLPFAWRTSACAYAVVVALVCVGGHVFIWTEGSGSRRYGDADRAILAVKAVYDAKRLEHGLVVADKLAAIYRTAFYLRNNASYRLLPAGATVATDALPGDAEWVLAFTRYRIPGWESVVALPGGASLYRRAASAAASAQLTSEAR